MKRKNTGNTFPSAVLKDPGDLLQGPVFYLVLAAALFIVFMVNIFNGNMGDSVQTDRICLMTLILMAGFSYIFARVKDKPGMTGKEKKEIFLNVLVYFTLSAGFLLRIAYALYTPTYVRTHDLGSFSGDNSGHLNYIYYLYTNKRLPLSNDFELYHPPLYHFLCAVVYALAVRLAPGRDPGQLLEIIKVVNCFSSCATLAVIYRIFTELELKGELRAAATAVCAFMPVTFIFAGLVNNDSMSFFFYMMAVLYLIKWCRNKDFKDIIIMAFSTGLGMMTKTSVGMFAFTGGPFMIYIFIKAVKKGSWKKILIQFLSFGAVAVPLGMWFPVRQWIRFRQPLGYVFKIGKDSMQYLGDVSPVKRFFSFPVVRMLKKPFANPFGDQNVNIYAIESSLFGEWHFDDRKVLAEILAAAALVLVLFSLAGMLFSVIKGKIYDPSERYLPALMWFTMMVSFYYFNVKYPQGCSMDYRYIPQTFVAGAYYIARGLELLNCKIWKRREKNVRGTTAVTPEAMAGSSKAYPAAAGCETKKYKFLKAVVFSVILVFCVFSATVYLKPGL